MMACVAIASDTRMDSGGGTCGDNLHVRMSDDLDASFRPGMGMLTNVDVLSAYMTAAAVAASEIVSEREERASADTLAAAIDSMTTGGDELQGKDKHTSPRGRELKVAADVDDHVKPAAGTGDVPAEAASFAPTVQKQAEEIDGSVYTDCDDDDAVESKQELNKVGEQANVEVSVLENSVIAEGADVGAAKAGAGAARPAEEEDAANKTGENLTESLAKLAKSHPFQFTGLNHVAFCCESLERSLDFYCGLLGLKTDLRRPDLPYRGAWLCMGAEGIHLMEVPNPDPVKDRPAHGGYDRHACFNVKNVDHLRMAFDEAGISYQLSIVPSIFCRDPDGNGLEFIEVNGVHVD